MATPMKRVTALLLYRKSFARNISLSSENIITKEQATVKLAAWMKFYEDTIGITDVKDAQTHCIVTEKKLVEAQENRREVQLRIHQVQTKLKEVHLELDKASRGEDRYLQLITQEHAILREERQLHQQFELHEKAERQYFSALSNAMRESHERERAYAEKTKYWSIIGSVCGAFIGIVGTSINNWIRLRELRDIVQQSAASGATVAAGVTPELRDLLKQVLSDLQQNRKEMSSIMAGEPTTNRRFETETMGRLDSIASDHSSLKAGLDEIKTLVVAERMAQDFATDPVSDGSYPSGAVVYLGRDVEQMVKNAQHNLEWKIKVSSIATVATIYAGIAITIPILYKLFGG